MSDFLFIVVAIVLVYFVGGWAIDAVAFLWGILTGIIKIIFFVFMAAAIIAGLYYLFLRIKENKVARTYKEEYNLYFDNLHDKLIYIDTNVFMNNKYEWFFEELIEKSIKIQIPSIQYNEFIKVKREKGHAMSKAFKILEKLIDNSLLDDFIDDDVKETYFDAELKTIISDKISGNVPLVVFSDDRALRIEIKSLLKQEQNAKYANNIQIIEPYKELNDLERKGILSRKVF